MYLMATSKRVESHQNVLGEAKLRYTVVGLVHTQSSSHD